MRALDRGPCHPYTGPMTSPMDPKEAVLTKFQALDIQGIDLVTRRATDSPLVVKTLLDGIADVGVAGKRIIELGFGSGWLLEAMRDTFPETRLYGLDLSVPMTQRPNHSTARMSRLSWVTSSSYHSLPPLSTPS